MLSDGFLFFWVVSQLLFWLGVQELSAPVRVQVVDLVAPATVLLSAPVKNRLVADRRGFSRSSSFRIWINTETQILFCVTLYKGGAGR